MLPFTYESYDLIDGLHIQYVGCVVRDRMGDIPIGAEFPFICVQYDFGEMVLYRTESDAESDVNGIVFAFTIKVGPCLT